jgi:hypothetical protein
MAKRKKPQFDFSICDSGSIVSFTLRSAAARDWVAENCPDVEGWQWMGENTLCVEWRCAKNLQHGMEEAGLVRG